MPGSANFGKVYTALLLRKLFEDDRYKHVVDIGAGSGTYRRLMEGATQVQHWTAVEAWFPYIADYGLTRLYDAVIHCEAQQFDFAAAKPDLTLCGDVLEHMTKEQAVDVVTRALNAGSDLLISIPVIPYPQGEANGNPYERHVKDDWSHNEVITAFPSMITAVVHEHIGVYYLSPHPERHAPLRALHRGVARLVKEQCSGELLLASGLDS